MNHNILKFLGWPKRNDMAFMLLFKLSWSNQKGEWLKGSQFILWSTLNSFCSFLKKINRPRFEFKTLDDNADIMAAPFDKNDIAYNIIRSL